MHCGREVCLGPNGCENWPKCRAETIPPWNCIPAKSTATVCIREQDILAAADELFDAVKNWREYQTHNTCDEKGWSRVAEAMRGYRDAREGIRK